MRKTKFEATFEFLKALTFGNLAGGLGAFLAAFIMFFLWRDQGAGDQTSAFDDALNVGIFLFPVGLMYSLLVISPFVIFLQNRKRAFLVCVFVVAIAPGLLLIGNGYWHLLALTYGLSTLLVFLKIYSISEKA
jgi:hypothetical protein